MAKRQPIAFDSKKLTNHLKESAGKGMDAFFSPTPNLQVSEVTQQVKEEEIDKPFLDSQVEIQKQLGPVKEKDQSTEVSMQASKHTSMHAYMQAVLGEKATYSFAFRYPPEILDKLEDILHFARTNNRTKLTKNSLAVAALSFLLWEFETKGEKSMLYQILIEKAK